MILHHETRGDGPPVLLIHAGIADSRMWAPVAKDLARDHLVVAPDLRGFGRSPLAPGRLSHRDDLLRLLDALGIERAAFVAASMGGAVALEVALHAPARVSALVLLDSAIDEFEPSAELEAYWAQEEAALEAGELEAAVEVTLRTWLDRPGRAAAADGRVRDLVAVMARDAYVAQAGIEAEEDEPDPPVTQRLAEITAPALVVAGEDDAPDFVAIARLLAERLPGARALVTIPGAAHLPALERPGEVIRVVRPFLAEAGVSATARG